MYISISESGTKEEVAERLRNHSGADTAKRIAALLADHVEENAAAGAVSVSLSGSLSFTKKETSTS